MTLDKAPILLVEDEEAHVELTIRAIRKAGNTNEVIAIEDGEEALDYLYNRNKYENRDIYPSPCLILLDIKLPGLGGIEILKQIKKDPRLRRIPVIMLTTSERPKDINKAYDCHANSYLTKPVDPREFEEKIMQLEVYWTILNESPKMCNVKV